MTRQEGPCAARQEGHCMTRQKGLRMTRQEGHCIPRQKGLCMTRLGGHCMTRQVGHCIPRQEGHCMTRQEGHCMTRQEGHCMTRQEGQWMARQEILQSNGCISGLHTTADWWRNREGQKTGLAEGWLFYNDASIRNYAIWFCTLSQSISASLPLFITIFQSYVKLKNKFGPFSNKHARKDISTRS